MLIFLQSGTLLLVLFCYLLFVIAVALLLHHGWEAYLTQWGASVTFFIDHTVGRKLYTVRWRVKWCSKVIGHDLQLYVRHMKTINPVQGHHWKDSGWLLASMWELMFSFRCVTQQIGLNIHNHVLIVYEFSCQLVWFYVSLQLQQTHIQTCT